jgi:hypothetical protein
MMATSMPQSDIGVDLLMNPRKRSGSIDSGSVRSEPVLPPVAPAHHDGRHDVLDDVEIISVIDDRLSDMEDLGGMGGMGGAGGGAGGGGAGGRGGSGPQQSVPPPSEPFSNAHNFGNEWEDVETLKRDLLYKFERLEKRGITLPRRFGMHSSYQDMKREYERMERDRETDSSVRFQRKMLMALVTGVEFLNNRFDPFDVHLDGWSESVQESMTDYDDVFEALYDKYRTRAQIPPEVKLIMMVGGSAFMYHLSNTMFKSSLPGLQDVLRQNPDLMKQFASATMNTMANQSVPGARGFGNMFHNVFPTAAAPPPGPPPQPYFRPPTQPQSPPHPSPLQYQQSPTYQPPNPVGMAFFGATPSPPSPMKGPLDYKEILSNGGESNEPALGVSGVSGAVQPELLQVTVRDEPAEQDIPDDESLMADLLMNPSNDTQGDSASAGKRGKGKRRVIKL